MSRPEDADGDPTIAMLQTLQARGHASSLQAIYDGLLELGYIPHTPASRQPGGGQTQYLRWIADICRWYAADGPPTAQRQAAALVELAHITDGRTDLLAQYTGQSLAKQDTESGDTVHERAAQLRITAGANMSLIDRWSHQSRRDAAPRARRPSQG